MTSKGQKAKTMVSGGF